MGFLGSLPYFTYSDAASGVKFFPCTCQIHAQNAVGFVCGGPICRYLHIIEGRSFPGKLMRKRKNVLFTEFLLQNVLWRP